MASFQKIDCGPSSPLVVFLVLTSTHRFTAVCCWLKLSACDGQVILGWLNSKDKYVRKYADLLKALGYSTLRFSCPATDVMSIFERPRVNWAKRLLKEIQEEHMSPPRYENCFMLCIPLAIRWMRVP